MICSTVPECFSQTKNMLSVAVCWIIFWWRLFSLGVNPPTAADLDWANQTY